MGRGVRHVAEQIGADAGVVEQGIALGGGTIAHDLLAGPLAVDQEGEEGVLDLVGGLLNAVVEVHGEHADSGFLGQQGGDGECLAVRGMVAAGPQAERAAMGGKFFDIPDA